VSHFDSKEVVIILLSLSAGGVLSENALIISIKLWSECGDRE